MGEEMLRCAQRDSECGPALLRSEKEKSERKDKGWLIKHLMSNDRNF